MAAVKNFHKVHDDAIRGDLAGTSKLHRVVLAKVDYDWLALYFIYRPKQVIQRY